MAVKHGDAYKDIHEGFGALAERVLRVKEDSWGAELGVLAECW